MKSKSKLGILEAIRNHPAILRAAITGSHARQSGEDQHSDLDVLLVARDLDAVRQVGKWVPQDWNVLICAFHLTHYCTILLDDLEKFDLAIFSADDPPSSWVVHDYTVIKGDGDFEVQLAKAAADCRTNKAAHLTGDVCMDNVLLLLISALKRVDRGELLSAHAFLAMTVDMLLSLERSQHQLEADADVLDPRRRLEKNQLEVAGSSMRLCLFHRIVESSDWQSISGCSTGSRWSRDNAESWSTYWTSTRELSQAIDAPFKRRVATWP